MSDLSCTVWTEVKEDHRIIVLDRCNWLSVFYYCKWLYELICLAVIVRSLDSCSCTFCRLSFALRHHVICFFYTIPSLITVHGIETSHNSRYLAYAKLCHLGFQFFYKAFTRFWWSVTAI